MTRRNWKTLQPTSLRHALELCKDHARERLNKGVERIADDMGLADHWALYKYLQRGSMPANLIRPYELACGIDFVTRWFAGTSGKLLVDMASGRKLNQADVADLHKHFATALELLAQFYDKPTDPTATLAALTTHMAHVAWHRENVAQHITPQLELEP
jgi:hypothetical protein